MIHDHEAEQAALAIVLSGKRADSWAILSKAIGTPLAFYERDHQIVALACANLSARGDAPDAMAVSGALQEMSFGQAVTRLREIGKEARPDRLPKLPEDGPTYEDSSLAGIGGFQALANLAGIFAPVGSMDSVAKRIASYALLRAAQEALSRAQGILATPQGLKSRQSVLDALCAELQTTGQSESEGSLGDGAAAALANGARAKDDPGASVACRWGVPSLDSVLKLRPGGLTILAAKPGGGKTSLALSVIESTAAVNAPGAVALLSMEMGKEELGAILLARVLVTPTHRIHDGLLMKIEIKAALRHAELLKGYGIATRDSATSNKIEEVEAWLRQRSTITAGAVRLLVIDHVGLITPGHRQNIYEATAMAYKRLKTLARSTGVHILALSQMNRNSTGDRKGADVQADKRPVLSDLRNAGEEDADNVVFLWNPDGSKAPRQSRLAIIDKNRGGPKVDVPLWFEPANGQRFLEPDAPLEIPPYGNNRMSTPPSDSEGVF